VSAGVPRKGVDALAAEVASKRLERVYAVEHEWLTDYTADGFTAALEQLIRQVQPSIVLFPHTSSPGLRAEAGCALQPGSDLT
jgi:electron transfer flavoprotein alpha subunit